MVMVVVSFAKDTPEISPAIYEGISIFVGVWESLAFYAQGMWAKSLK